MRRNKPFIFPKSPPVSSPAVAAGPAPPDGLAERLTLGALLGLAIAVVSAAAAKASEKFLTVGYRSPGSLESAFMTTFSTATGKARLGLALLSATGGCVRSWGSRRWCRKRAGRWSIAPKWAAG